MIVKMIIHPIAAGMCPVRLRRQSSGVAEIVLAEQQDHVIKLLPAPQPLAGLVAIVIVLHLFIDGKHSRNILQVLVHILTQQRVLCLDRVLDYLHIVRKPCVLWQQHRIALSTHSNRNHIFIRLVSQNAVLPKFCDGLLV